MTSPRCSDAATITGRWWGSEPAQQWYILELVKRGYSGELPSEAMSQNEAAAVTLGHCWQYVEDQAELFAIFQAATLVLVVPPSDGLLLEQITDISGISWSFHDGEHLSGQYISGGWWTVGPVEVLPSPTCITAGMRVKHGSMINPAPGFAQGYDSSQRDGVIYKPGLNPARGGDPFVVQPGSSLVSCRSNPLEKQRPQLYDAAILTVLYQPPPKDSFRPPYVGSSKVPPATLSDIDWSKLPTIDWPGSGPPQVKIAGDQVPDKLVPVLRAMERPWLQHISDYSSRYHHAAYNQPVYGAEIAETSGACALASMDSSLPESDRRTLAIRLIQWALDAEAITRHPAFDPIAHWRIGGGHSSGRGPAWHYASRLLPRHAGLASLTSDSSVQYNEAGQCFYVPGASYGLPVGTPEWCNQYARGTNQCSSKWAVPTSNPLYPHLRYRTSDTQRAWWAWQAALHAMDTIPSRLSAWADYSKRYYQIQVLGSPTAPPQTHATLPWALECWRQRFLP